MCVMEHREESQGRAVAAGFQSTVLLLLPFTVTTALTGRGLMCHLQPHVRGVLPLASLQRRQNRGPEKQTDLPQNSHSETAELEPQPPSAWLDSLVLKGHIRPQEQLVMATMSPSTFTTGKRV